MDDAKALLSTLAEFQAQLDEEDEDLPNGLIDGLEELRKKLSNYPGVHWSSKPICVQRWDFLSTSRSLKATRWPFSR